MGGGFAGCSRGSRRHPDCGRVYVPLFHCPSRGIPNDTKIGTFATQCKLNKNKTSNGYVNPFGKPDATDGNNPALGIQPIRYSELETFGGPSRVWALLEEDKQITANDIPATDKWRDQLPEHPPHGGKRTCLWFDGRVNLLDGLP
jgi:prepilin-type processing-associated H-X9-DG protein